MGRSARQLISLTLACAFSSCFAEVALGVELSPETTSFQQMATSAQPLYRSSPHQSSTAHFNSPGSLQATPRSHRTTAQTTEQRQPTTAAGQRRAEQAGAGTVPTVPADSTSTDSQATAQALLSVSAAVTNKTTPSVSSTRRGGRSCATTGMAAAATNTSVRHETTSTQVTVTGASAATTNTSVRHETTSAQVTATGASAAATTQRAGCSTRSRRQTTGSGSVTATAAVANTATTRAGTQTAPTSPARTVRPPPGPQPSPIPTGTYTVSNGNGTCVKAIMGLQLMARNTEQEQIEYVTVNPNATRISGSCGMVQSELTLTFSGGFVNFTFVKQAPSYFVSKIESRLQFSSEGMLYYAALNEKLFTTKLGNSFKCASRQTFTLERNFQILFVHVQLQAFDIVGNQFGKEEECFPDRNSKAAPIAVCLSILGLFVIVFATFLISRRKPHRGYERI